MKIINFFGIYVSKEHLDICWLKPNGSCADYLIEFKELSVTGITFLF